MPVEEVEHVVGLGVGSGLQCSILSMRRMESVLSLCEGETIPVFLKFNAKESRCRTKVFESKMSLE